MRIAFIISLLPMLALSFLPGCHRDPVKPPDKVTINGRVRLWVTDLQNNPLESALVVMGTLKQTIKSYEYTSPLGTTREHYYTLDSANNAIGVEVKKENYVTILDTFALTELQPQLVQVKIPNDTGYITGRVIFIVRDTASYPIQFARVTMKYYPGPLWGHQDSTWDISDGAGRTAEYLLHIDPYRNALISTVTCQDFIEEVDTFAVIKDQLIEIEVTLIQK